MWIETHYTYRYHQSQYYIYKNHGLIEHNVQTLKEVEEVLKEWVLADYKDMKNIAKRAEVVVYGKTNAKS